MKVTIQIATDDDSQITTIPTAIKNMHYDDVLIIHSSSEDFKATLQSLKSIKSIVIESPDGYCTVFKVDYNQEELKYRLLRDLDEYGFKEWIRDHGYNNPSGFNDPIRIGVVQDLIGELIDEIWPNRPENKFSDMSENEFVSWLSAKHAYPKDEEYFDEIECRLAPGLIDDAIGEVIADRGLEDHRQPYH
ncbi:MAG: hypothetical protein K6F57_03640 [Candidatus Saccharibacteria bacterium]|nr:hypothetical protein [Candidatus Saccharibacteria bacterium]